MAWPPADPASLKNQSSSTWRLRQEDIEPIELELEKLIADFLEAVPALGPVLECRANEHRYAVHRDTGPSQHGLVDERRTLTAKAGGDDNDGPQTLSGEKVPDLIGGIETDGLGCPDWHDLGRRHPRDPRHQFGNAYGHGIRSRRLV